MMLYGHAEIKHPPRKVKVQVVPHETDVKGKKSMKVWVELEGVKLVLEKKKEEKKKTEKKPEEKKAEAKPAEKKPEAQKAAPEAKHEEKKDAPKQMPSKRASESCTISQIKGAGDE